MKACAACLLFLATTLALVEVKAQVSSNVFERVLFVRVNAGTHQKATATAFTIDVDGREYLITAKHVVEGLKDKGSIDIFMNNGWSPLQVTIFRCDDPTDIAVLIPPHQLTVNFDLPFDEPDIQFGQDAFFLGFPYGIENRANGINGPYPLALIKRGTLSSEIALDPTRKAILILLDGYNNPGFSGGPIVFHDTQQGGYVMKLLGVVSGFIPEVVPVMKEHNIKAPTDAGAAAKAQSWKIKKRSDGTYFEYVDNGTFVALNTGIVQGYAIYPAIDLIRQHPIGPEVKDLPGNNPPGIP